MKYLKTLGVFAIALAMVALVGAVTDNAVVAYFTGVILGNVACWYSMCKWWMV